jgi:hypothetical protein
VSADTKTKDPLQFLDEAMAGLKADGLYRRLRILHGEQRRRALTEGRRQSLLEQLSRSHHSTPPATPRFGP